MYGAFDFARSAVGSDKRLKIRSLAHLQSSLVHFVGIPTEDVLAALLSHCVLGFKKAKPQTRKFRAGATPFALALSRVISAKHSRRP